MEEYKSNSHKAKTEAAETKKVNKVVKGKVVTKKKNAVSKVADNLISEDVHNVKDYVLMDVLLPAVKKTIFDMITNGLDMLLYNGEGRRDRKGSSPYVSYNRFSDNRSSYRRESDRPRQSRGYSHDDIVLESRGEAEEVLDRMDELLDTYGMVSVADLYDLVGITGEYTDNKYGWTSLRSAEAIRVRDGYMLKLPRALPLN